MSADVMLSRLAGVKPTGRGRWVARCPAHDDKHPSLSLKVGDSGALLLYCWAGCSLEEIVAAVGVQLSDLFPRCETETDLGGKWKPYVQKLSRLAPLVTRLQTDILICHVLLSDIASAKPITDEDQATAKAAATRLWHVVVEGQYVL